MACGSEGCDGNIVVYKLLSKEGLQHIFDVLSGKLFTIWGSLRLSAKEPLHLEKTYGDGGETIVEGYVDEAGVDSEGNYTSGVMSAADKEKLDGISVSGVTEGNGLSVDEDGNISMGAASDTEAGAMSAEDKAKLDTLQSYDVATEESDGLMSAEDKAALDNLTSEYRLELSQNVILFTNTTNMITLTATAYKGVEKVNIDSMILSLTDGLGRADFLNAGHTIVDGVATITIRRERACANADGSLGIIANVAEGRTQIPIANTIVPIYSADHNHAVLQGWVNPVYEEKRMRAQFWTFDGSAPTVRFVRDGAYWINLPTEWAELLGELDLEKLIVQTTIGGEGDGVDVFCGRFAPGGEWNGDTASEDCWAAVLMLVRDKDVQPVNNSFYISVYYVPDVNTYYADNEEEPTVEMHYDTPEAVLSYDSVSQTNTSVMPNLSYSQAWQKYYDGQEIQGGVTTVGGDVGYELVENLAPTYFNVSVDETTGKVTIATAEGIWAGHSMEVATVRVHVTMNGLTGYADTTIMYEI